MNDTKHTDGQKSIAMKQWLLAGISALHAAYVVPCADKSRSRNSGQSRRLHMLLWLGIAYMHIYAEPVRVSWQGKQSDGSMSALPM